MKPFSGSLEVAHVVLGSIALGLGFLQILAILGRPAPVCCCPSCTERSCRVVSSTR